MKRKFNWKVLDEKETLICFMVDYYPFATFRRISTGVRKGTYKVSVTTEPSGKEHKAKISNKLDIICSLWRFGEVYWQWEEARDTYGRYMESDTKAIIYFSFSKEL